MTRQKPIAGVALLAVAALVAGAGWRLAGAFDRPEAAAALVFVAATLLVVTVVGVRSRRWTETPYW